MSHDLYRQLAFNGSGYYDGTAYKAIKEVYKMNEPLCADIWTIQNQTGTTNEALIIAKHERYVTILTLTDKEPPENPVKVHSIANRYTDVGKIRFAFNENLCDYVKTLTDAEFDKIMRKVAAALGLAPAIENVSVEHVQEPATNPQSQPVVFTEKVETVQPVQFPGVFEGKLSPAPTSGQKIHDLQVELATVQKERDIYKDLFYQAMPQLKSVV